MSISQPVTRLPLIDASSETLADPHLLRAAHVLAMLSHAYVYAEPSAVTPPPATLTTPWAIVCQRLGRPTMAMSYIDLIVYNFRFVDASRADPFRVDNLRLLTPAFDTREEHVFYLTQVEILAQSAPIVGADLSLVRELRQGQSVPPSALPPAASQPSKIALSSSVRGSTGGMRLVGGSFRLTYGMNPDFTASSIDW